MDDPFTSPPSTADTPHDQTINSPGLSTEISSKIGAKNNVCLASLDLDHPGPEVNSLNCDLPYDDLPSPSDKIKEAILSTCEAASQRITEAQALFAPIIRILDGHCNNNNPLIPAGQIRALTDLHEELAVVTRRHFEAFVRGASALASNNDGTMPTQKSTPTKGISQSSYAQAASSNTHSSQQLSTTNNVRQINKEPQKPSPDERLFLRLSEDDQLRTLSGYALQTLLKSKLGPDGKLLANTLPTKTGFALCPTKGNSEILAEKLSATNTLNGKLIERASPWISYRISNVPRRFGTTNDNLQLSLEPVTTFAVSDAITVAAGTPPISVTPSRDNDAQPDSPTTSWIVRFEEEHIVLPRVLYLFGYRTTSRVLPQRSSVTQCTRCWLWHNSRVCSSPTRCRLCGSSNHTEQEHKNLCAGPSEHTCPPKCIHCHGPHPADFIKCELRPCPTKSQKTKTQIAAIRRVFAESRLRSQAEAGCRNNTISGSSNLNNKTPTSIAPPSNNQSDPNPPKTVFPSASISPANNLQRTNPFEILNLQEELRNTQTNC